MFKFVGVNEFPQSSLEEVVHSNFFHFDMEIEDYFLRKTPAWDDIRTEAYLVKLENSDIWIPSNYYVMVADVYGEVDWVCIDEAIGRPMDLLVLSSDFRTWSLKRLSIIDHDDHARFFWPNTKAAVPVCNDPNEIIILSTYDQYKNTKDKTIDIFVS